MPRQKPVLYAIQAESSRISDEFIHALIQGLLLTLREAGIELEVSR